MFSVHTAPDEFKNATIIVHFEFVVEKKLGQMIIVGVIVSKSSVFKMLFGHTKTKGSVFVTD